MAARARPDVVVLGAGLLGAALTYHLSRQPGLSVRTFERGPASEGATAGSAGILSYQGWDAWDLGLVRETAEQLQALSDRHGAGRYRVEGGLRVARTPEGAHWLERVRGVLDREGVPSRLLGPEELGPHIPSAALGDVRVGLHTPDDATFDPAEASAEYARMASREGAEIHFGRSTTDLRWTGERWRLGFPEGPVEADQVVLACGAWTKWLLASLGLGAPLSPFRTQACVLRPRPLLGPFPTLHDLDLNLYVRPGYLGRIVAGDGTGDREVDPDLASPTADPDFLDRLGSCVRDLFPGLDSVRPERAWAGVCVASPDRYPLVGRVPGAIGLHIATGFNGFGTMRAPALARRLADAIAGGSWSSLAPADPLRFAGSVPPFDPRPEFPLEGGPWAGPATAPSVAPATSQDFRWDERPIQYRALGSIAEVDRLEFPPLSEWFDPFLGRFLRDALRTGGVAEVAESDGQPVGAYLLSPTEAVGSVFTRRRAVAEHYLANPGRGGVYADRAWAPGGEPIEILAADLVDWELRRPMRNAVRIGTTEDLPGVRALMEAMSGTVDDAWFRTFPRRDELCFLCELDGHVAGISWASVEGRYARGHSFLVHPRYRGLGIGTDLLQARMLWLKDAGVRQVVSEIYEGNVASETSAERAGMAPVGRMFHFHAPDPAPGGPSTAGLRSSAPRTSGRPSPSTR